MSRPARIIVAIFFALALAEAVSLVERGARGYTDVGVFYRTCVLLAGGGFLCAGMFLALPAAIKLYPVMMLAIPISLARSVRIGLRILIGFMLGIVIFSALVPAFVYGSRASDLNASFWHDVILSPTGQVAYMQTLRAANQ